MEIFSRIQPHDAARPHAPGPSRPLRRRRLADASDVQRRQPGPGRIDRDARQAAVDHRRHAFDGDRAFSHVGRQNQLALRGRRYGAVLLLRREIAIQRSNRIPCACASGPHAVAARRISAAPGRNTSTSPSSPCATRLGECACDLHFERLGRVRAMRNLQLELAPLALQNRAACRGSSRPAPNPWWPTSPRSADPDGVSAAAGRAKPKPDRNRGCARGIRRARPRPHSAARDSKSASASARLPS